MPNKIIFHIDMDAFYPSVEQREHPEWKGKSVIVGADPQGGKGRGVVASPSYEAREFGVRSAMSISKAWRLCPQGVYLRPNFALYEKVSSEIMVLLRKYADKFEQVGLDEAFLDVSRKVNDFDEAAKLADRIRKDVFDKEKLTCSIGIGSNKLIAKLGSDYRKPYGLTVVKSQDVKKFLDPLPVRKLIGVGPKTEIKLGELGVKTIGELAKFKKETLVKIFGKWGANMHELANGIDYSEVTEEHEIKSIGRETTFEEDTNDKGLIFKTIESLVDEFHQEIKDGNISFKTVTVKVRYENFETHTHAKTFEFYTNDKEIIKYTAKQLVQQFLNLGRKVRLIGVRISGLKSGEKQKKLGDLFHR